MMQEDFYISVDVETAGPFPERFSLLSIGACTLERPRRTFYIELKPVNNNFTPEALEISQLSPDVLSESGIEPVKAMAQFDDWLKMVAAAGQRPVFVAFNAAFDWMFVSHYFHHYLGHNPFGHAALDVKSFYMGIAGVTWMETSMRYVTQRYLSNKKLTHHALQDALDQAELFEKLLEAARDRV